MQAGLRGYLSRKRVRNPYSPAHDSTKKNRYSARRQRPSNEEKHKNPFERRNRFERVLTAKARVAQKASEKLVRARMKATMRASRVLVRSWIEGAAEVDPWSDAADIEKLKAFWLGLLDECIHRMEAKELEVKGIGSARLRAVIQRDQEPASWPLSPPFCPNPLRWLRAKALYALLPADKDIWYFVLRERRGLLFHCALICPFGVATVAWLLLLLAIVMVEDTYQLWNYIVSFKVYAFVFWGFIPIFTTHFKLYIYLTGNEAGSCAASWAPHTPLWQNGLFGLNWLLCFAIFGRLISVHRQQLKLHRPITKLLYTDMSSDSSSSSSSSDDGASTSSTSSESSVDPEALSAELAVKALRGRAPKARATGTEITLIMKYDLAVTLIFCLTANADLMYRITRQSDVAGYFMTLAAAQENISPPTQDAVRIFYDLSLTHLALLGMPFLMFSIPFVGETLHQMRLTAYDQMGRLRLQMEPWQMKEKMEKEKEEAEEAEALAEKAEKERAAQLKRIKREQNKLRKSMQKQKKKKASATNMV